MTDGRSQLPNTPDDIGWKEFEKVVRDRGEWEHKNGNGIWKKNQMNAVHTGDGVIARPGWVDFSGTIPFLYDFNMGEGRTEQIPLPHPIHFDTKRVAGSSMPLNEDHFTRKQKKQLLAHAHYGATCFLLVHFCRRDLSTKTDIAQTIAMPVHPDHEFWEMVSRGQVSSLSRENATKYGYELEWTKAGTTRTFRPDIITAVKTLKEREIPLFKEGEAPW